MKRQLLELILLIAIVSALLAAVVINILNINTKFEKTIEEIRSSQEIF